MKKLSTKFMESNYSEGLGNVLFLSFDEDLILNIERLSKVFNGITLKPGVNIVEKTFTDEELPILTKGVKITVSLSILKALDNDIQCVYVKHSFNITGRGSKKYRDDIVLFIERQLIDEKCVYSYLQREIPKPEDLTEDLVLFTGVDNESYMQKTLTVKKIDLSNATFSELEENKELKESNVNNIFFKEEFMLFENALYSQKKEYYDTLEKVVEYYTFRQAHKTLLVSDNATYIQRSVDIKELTVNDDYIEYYPMSDICKQPQALYLKKNNMLVFNINPNSYFTYSEISNMSDIYMQRQKDNTVRLYSNKDNLSIKKITDASIIFSTNIPAKKFSYLSSGKYISAEINEKKFVLAPINLESVEKAVQTIELYLWKDKLYAIVGEYDKIGFSLDTPYDTISIYITTIPEYQDQIFYNSFNDAKNEFDKLSENIPYKYPKKIKFECFDDDFLKRKKVYNIGNEVAITKEITDKSSVKGLKGVIKKISPNNQIFTLNHHPS